MIPWWLVIDLGSNRVVWVGLTHVLICIDDRLIDD